jgi:hypothetical protein
MRLAAGNLSEWIAPGVARKILQMRDAKRLWITQF